MLVVGTACWRKDSPIIFIKPHGWTRSIPRNEHITFMQWNGLWQLPSKKLKRDLVLSDRNSKVIESSMSDIGSWVKCVCYVLHGYTLQTSQYILRFSYFVRSFTRSPINTIYSQAFHRSYWELLLCAYKNAAAWVRAAHICCIKSAIISDDVLNAWFYPPVNQPNDRWREREGGGKTREN